MCCDVTPDCSCPTQSITDVCDDKQNELEGILALANEMYEYGVSEEAGEKIDGDMDQLKEGWVRLCEKLESVNVEVDQVVRWWREYHEVRVWLRQCVLGTPLYHNAGNFCESLKIEIFAEKIMHVTVPSIYKHRAT